MIRKRSKYIILSIIIGIPLFIFLIFPALSGPWVYRHQRYIDFNSGDYKSKYCVFNIPIHEEIQETPFSTEVRRLGISVPEERLWRCVGRSYLFSGGLGIHARYDGVPNAISYLMASLNESNMPDNDRLDIIQKALKCLQTDSTGEVQEIRDMTKMLMESNP